MSILLLPLVLHLLFKSLFISIYLRIHIYWFFYSIGKSPQRLSRFGYSSFVIQYLYLPKSQFSSCSQHVCMYHNNSSQSAR